MAIVYLFQLNLKIHESSNVEFPVLFINNRGDILEKRSTSDLSTHGMAIAAESVMLILSLRARLIGQSIFLLSYGLSLFYRSWFLSTGCLFVF